MTESSVILLHICKHMNVELLIYSLISFLYLPSIVAPLLHSPNPKFGWLYIPFQTLTGPGNYVPILCIASVHKLLK